MALPAELGSHPSANMSRAFTTQPATQLGLIRPCTLDRQLHPKTDSLPNSMSCTHKVFVWEIVGHLVSPCNGADARPVDVQALRWARQLWVHVLQLANEFSIQCVFGEILHGSQTYSRRVGYRSTAQCA